MAGPPTAWTAAHVLRGLRLAMTSQPTLLRFVLDRAREVLGENSREFVALVLRCGPAPGPQLAGNGSREVRLALLARRALQAQRPRCRARRGGADGRRHCGSGAAGARRIGRGSYRIRPVGARPGDPAPAS
jgi:hypothetical protein